MSETVLAAPITQAALPENFPAVSVSLAWARKLNRAGRQIDVDLFALNEVLTSRGVPSEMIENIDFQVGPPCTARAGNAGVAWINSQQKRCAISIYPTHGHMHGRKQSNLQRTIIHEAQHVSDFINQDMVKDVYIYSDYSRRKKLRETLGTTAAIASCVSWMPEVIKDVTIPCVESSHSFPAALGGIYAPLGGVLLSYIAGKHALYKSSPSEKSARFAASHFNADTPRIISFSKI